MHGKWHSLCFVGTAAATISARIQKGEPTPNTFLPKIQKNRKPFVGVWRLVLLFSYRNKSASTADVPHYLRFSLRNCIVLRHWRVSECCMGWPSLFRIVFHVAGTPEQTLVKIVRRARLFAIIRKEKFVVNGHIHCPKLAHVHTGRPSNSIATRRSFALISRRTRTNEKCATEQHWRRVARGESNGCCATYSKV